MNRSMLLLGSYFFFACSCPVFAVDIPQDDIGSQQLSTMNCVNENAQTCINNVCPNSEETDCQDKCLKMAKEKCRKQSNQ